jgi:hypothetical protein
LKVGAQPTEQAGKLLEIAGVWAAYKADVGKDRRGQAKVKVKAKTVKPDLAGRRGPSLVAEPAARRSRCRGSRRRGSAGGSRSGPGRRAGPGDEPAVEATGEEPAAEESA